jgi:hypothetical protein
MKRTLLTLAALAIASVSQAQSPTDYTISHYLASNPNGAPVGAPYTFSKTSPALQCGRPATPPITTVQINPRFYRWNDPDNPSLECVFDKTLATTPLFADPPPGGDYVARVVAILKVGSATLTSALSDPSNPFVRGTIPPVVLNLRVTGQ